MEEKNISCNGVAKYICDNFDYYDLNDFIQVYIKLCIDTDYIGFGAIAHAIIKSAIEENEQ